MEIWGLAMKTSDNLVLIGVSEDQSTLDIVVKQRKIANPTISKFEIPETSFLKDIDRLFDSSIGDIILTTKEYKILNCTISEKLRNKILMESILEANLLETDLSIKERKTLEIILKDVRLMLDSRLKIERSSIFEFLEYRIAKQLKGVDRDDGEILRI